VRCLSVTTADCPFANGNRTAFCGACGCSSENVLIVSDEEFKRCVPNDVTLEFATSLERLEASGDVNVVSIDVLPNTDASAKFYLINTGDFDAESVTVTFTGVDGCSETRTLSVPVFHPRAAPVEFVVPIRVKAQRAGEVAVGMFSVSYIPRKGTSRSYTRRVSATVPSPAEMHVSCELMTFSQRVRTRTFRISNLGGLPGYVNVNLRADTTQWGLSYLPNNGFGYAPANLLQYLIPAHGFLTFQVACNGQSNPGAISITGDSTNHSIVLSYDGERIQQNLNRPIYMVGIDLGTRQTSAVIRYLPLGQEPPQPVMVDLSKSGQDGEVRVETKILIDSDGSISCGTDIEFDALSEGLVIHELKSMLYEASQSPSDKDYLSWWNRNSKLTRFSHNQLEQNWFYPDLDKLFRDNVSIYEQLLRWTFQYMVWLKAKIRNSLKLKAIVSGWPDYDYAIDGILWVFTVPVRDYAIGQDSAIPEEHNRYVLTLLRVLCRANWFASKTPTVVSRIDEARSDCDLTELLRILELDYGVRFELESVAAIAGVYNHPVSRDQFTTGLVGKNIYLIDSGGGTTDAVHVAVRMNEINRVLTIVPIEVLGHDSEGEIFGGELISSSLMTYCKSSEDITEVSRIMGVKFYPSSAHIRVFAEDTKKLRPTDIDIDLGAGSRRFTWGTLRSLQLTAPSSEWNTAVANPTRFVTSLVPSANDTTTGRSIAARIESMVASIQSRYQLGSSVTDDYYILVGGNSKFVPLQSAVRARFGVGMTELLPTTTEQFDKLRELFVCFGSVFVRDSTSDEVYEYTIRVAINGEIIKEMVPGIKTYRQYVPDVNRLEISISTVRNNKSVVIESSVVLVKENVPLAVMLEGVDDSVQITVAEHAVVEYFI
jgi:hypothetical protein